MNANPSIVSAMQACVLELRASEATIEASGLCPFTTGKGADSKCREKANQTGFWMPWCDAGFPCIPAGHPTPIPAPTPPIPPTPAPDGTCTNAERAKAAMPLAIVRADALVQSASPLVAGKQSWTMVVPLSLPQAAAYMFQLKGNSSLCLGLHGGTVKNPQHGQARLLVCDEDDLTQKWLKSVEKDGTFTLQHNQKCLDLQSGAYIMESCTCNHGPNQLYSYDNTTGHLKFAEGKNEKVVDVC